jgi:DNA-binding NarL/FixJ family response regulator
MANARERCDARMVAAYADHVAARAAGDPAALLETAEAFAAIGADRFAMEAAADAAPAFAAAGRQDSARRAAARALELHVEHQGGAAPEIRGVDAADVLLTPRESQLVALAARGMGNAEIADQLVLSVRTVESHIYRAMQKLGVSDRRDLRA